MNEINSIRRLTLGLDLGVTSIGWALIEVDEINIPLQIIAMGSRIIPLTSDERDEFSKGQAVSKNQNRTKARTQRKGYDRKQLRKSDLKEILKKLDIEITPELMNLPSLELWKLRSDSADTEENISAEQLGRILYMLNQKRGYKSARSEANADKKDTEYVAEVKNRFQIIQNENKTVGQYFYDKLSDANANNQYFRVKEKVLPREAYIEEFETIINIQKEKHDFLTDDIINQLRDEIIYYQRKLKSQKHLISICELEGCEKKVFDKLKNKELEKVIGPRVAPKSSPLNQLCKIWEVVNNLSLKVKNSDDSKYKWRDWYPTLSEKEAIATFLNTHSSMSFTELLGIIDLKKTDVYSNKQILKGIQGNKTHSAIAEIVGHSSPHLKFDLKLSSNQENALLVDKNTGEILEEKTGLTITKEIEREPLYQLWHTIYSIKDMEECKKALMKNFDLDTETADKLSKLDFNKDAYANKSHKAIRKILPYLMQGYNYAESCMLAGYNHSNSLTKEENENRSTKESLTLLPKNSLRQPVVEKILNQMIHIVNAIIDKYGKPTEIRVELARELKQSKEERDVADKAIRANNKLNEEVAKRLASLHLPTTKRYIQKYKFIFPTREKNITDAVATNQCLYCGKSFSLTEALTGSDFDVDHIIPKSLLFDDSQTNKVLVHRRCNKEKTNQTAYDFIAKKGEVELGSYLGRIDDWFKRGIISYSKMLRLKTSYEEYLERKKTGKETETDKKLWENFIDRQLRETAYISRKARELLQQVCNNVTATEGNVTAKLRELWGWNDVLMNLQLSKYKDVGQTEMREWTSEDGKNKHKKEVISDWIKRDDHRHHAIDALVVACTKQGYIQRLNTLNASQVRDEMLKKVEESELIFKEKLSLLEKYLIAEKPFSTKEVENSTDEILVSFKSGKKVATISKLKARGKNKKTGVLVPRGALHEQFVYGNIKVLDKDKPLKYLFENVDLIVDKNIKSKIAERLISHENDIKKALNSLKKQPIYIDNSAETILEKGDCFRIESVIKYPIKDLKAKDLPYVVDEKIKNTLQAKLDEHKGNEKEAFKDTVWFNEAKQIPIRSVRCFTKLKSTVPVKFDENGREIGYAIPGNNHHVAIYTNSSGEFIQHTCTFWHAVERKKNKLPIVIKNTSNVWSNVIDKDFPQSFIQNLPNDKLELKYSLQQNEMYILGLSEDDFKQAILDNNKRLLSKYLYLVWSVSENNFWFRHHLETKNSELKKTKGARESKRFYLFKSVGAFVSQNPIKVRVNHLGEISKVNE